MGGAETIKEFLVGLGFKVDQVGMSRFLGAVTGASAALTAFAATLNGAALAAAYGTKKIADEYIDIGKMADAYRTSAEDVDAFVAAANAVGADTEAAKTALRGLNTAMQGLTANSEETAAMFAGLGISVQDANGEMRSTTAVMAELQGKLDELSKEDKLKVFEALELDADVMQSLGSGFAGVAAEVENINKAVGLSVADAVERSREFGAAWESMRNEIQSWRMLATKALHSLAVKLMPMLREQLHKVAEGFATLRRRVMEYVPRIVESILPIAEVVQRALGTVTRLALRIASAAVAIIGWLVRINDATGGWALRIGLAVAAWRYLNLAFLTTPLGIILSLIAAIVLLIDDFLVWKEKGKSVIDWSGQAGEVMQSLIDTIEFLADLLVFAIGWWGEKLREFFDWLFPELGQMKDDWDATVAAIVGYGQTLIDAWERVKTWFSDFFDLMRTGFERVANAASTIIGGVQGAWGKVKGFFGSNTPSPRVQAALGGYGAQVSQNTTIHVNGTGSPQAVADRVARAQGGAANAMARNLREATS